MANEEFPTVRLAAAQAAPQSVPNGLVIDSSSEDLTGVGRRS
jgi:hypothetical protein